MKYNYFDTLDHWLQDADKIVKNIEQNYATLKIVLKIKDDIFFFKRWVEHHAKIVGYENLIIFDNMSSDPELEKVYRGYDTQLKIFRFGGMCDHLHNPKCYPLLYASLRKSCSYYIFLDADEFLTWVTPELSYYSDSRIVEMLADSDYPLIPATSIINTLGYPHRFGMNANGSHITSGMKWGKPVVSSELLTESTHLHNYHLLNDYKKFITNLFVKHLCFLSPQQRIKSNLLKLQGEGQIDTNVTLNDLLIIDIGTFSAKAQKYINEIKRLLEQQTMVVDLKQPLKSYEIQFNDDGKIIFKDESQKNMLSDFINFPENYRNFLLN